MKKNILWLALFSVIVILTSCQKAEEVTVTKYFQAMQANDKETLATMAIEPKDIEFKSYKIVSTAEPEVVDLELPGLKKQMEDLRKAKQDQVNIALDKKDQLDELQLQMEDTRRRTKQQELENKIKEFQAELAGEEQKVKDIQAQINTLIQTIKVEENMIRMSTGVGENFELYQGKTHRMKATVNVTLTSGEAKDYIFLLRKNVLTLEDKPHNLSRLIIIKIATVEEFEKEQQQKEE